MITLNKAQRAALKRIYDRSLGDDNPTWSSYRERRKTVQSAFDCVMIKKRGIWLGIELDGHTHS